MIKPSFLSRAIDVIATNATMFIVLSTVSTTPAFAATLFSFNFDGTLTGADPLGTSATEGKVNGNLVIDADIANNSSTPIAGRYDGAIQELNLTFAPTQNRNAVTFNTTDFPGRTNRLFVGARGTTEELQVLFGNVASGSPFFQPSSLGIIFISNDLLPTTQLKEVLINTSGIFSGEFKLTLSLDQVNDPNNQFSGSFTILRVPEPGNTVALILLPLGLVFLVKSRLKNSY